MTHKEVCCISTGLHNFPKLDRQKYKGTDVLLYLQGGDQGANIKLNHAEFIDKGQLSGDSVSNVLA